MRTSELAELLRREFGFHGPEEAMAMRRARKWANHYGIASTQEAPRALTDWDDAGVQDAVAQYHATLAALAAGRVGYFEEVADRFGISPASMRCYLAENRIGRAGLIWPADIGSAVRPRYVYDIEELRAARSKLRRYTKDVIRLSGGRKLRDLAPGRHGGEAAYKRQKCRCRWCVAGQSGRSARTRHDGEPQASIAIEALVRTLRDPTLTAEEIEELAEVLKAIASPVRATIIGVLGNTDGPVDWFEAFRILGWRSGDIEYHISKLAHAGVVERLGDKMARLADRYR